jgi:diguanylate cyclase (GGDEF)-like protein
MALVEALTAYFLALQFRFTKNTYFAALSGAFSYVAVLVFSQMLVFPAVFSKTGFFGAGPQSSIWLWAEWHTGFPAFVIIALLLQAYEKGRETLYRGRGIGVALMAAGPLAAVLLAIFTITQSGVLPVLITGGSYAALRESPVTACIIGLTLGAMLACTLITRLRDQLSLWLTIALLANLSDAAMTLASPIRYSLGWYAGRSVSLLSAAFVFCVFIFEFSRLYDRLTAANEMLAERAFLDGLTGAFNRGYFNDQFPREFRRASRERYELSVLLIDVDHFKTYNDHFGHQLGDVCLISLVAAMQRVTKRPADFVARYGGEEFVMVLPRTGAAGASCVAHDLQTAIATLGLHRSDTPAGAVTVSLGIASYDPRAQSFGADELIRRADNALYQAKQEGRNTIRLFAALAAAKLPAA